MAFNCGYSTWVISTVLSVSHILSHLILLTVLFDKGVHSNLVTVSTLPRITHLRFGAGG